MKRLFRRLSRKGLGKDSRPLAKAAAGTGQETTGYGPQPEVQSMRELVNLREVQRLQDAFAETSGLSLVLTGRDGYALTRPSNFSPLCRLVRKTDKGRRQCLKSERALVHKAKGLREPTLWTCQSAGLQLVCVPIRVQDSHLASWLVGQVFPQSMDEEQLRRYSQTIQADPERMLDAFRSLPRLSGEDLLSTAGFIQRLSRFIVETGLERLRLNAGMAGLERSAWELRGYQEYLEGRLKECTTTLRKQEQTIEELSITDSLTGCYNRKYLTRQLPDELSRAVRYGHSLSLAMARLDGLETINERYGEAAGDKCLQELIRILRQEIRGGTDWVARFEGGRFVLVFPETGLDSAHRVVERLRRKIERSRLQLGEERLPLTASFGLCTGPSSWSAEPPSADRLLACARYHLDRAGELGPNSVVIGQAE